MNVPTASAVMSATPVGYKLSNGYYIVMDGVRNSFTVSPDAAVFTKVNGAWASKQISVVKGLTELDSIDFFDLAPDGIYEVLFVVDN